MPYVISN